MLVCPGGLADARFRSRHPLSTGRIADLDAALV
jgi:hypothetical protein